MARSDIFISVNVFGGGGGAEVIALRAASYFILLGQNVCPARGHISKLCVCAVKMAQLVLRLHLALW